nr:hypothetical protein [Tanacetum cinerariifolium]
MFSVDRTEVRGTMPEEHLHLEMGELRLELAILNLVKQSRLSVITAMENGVVLDEEQLLFIAAGQTNTFDDDVDEAPVQDLALNKENVQDRDNYNDSVGEYHEVHEMQNDVQPNYVVDSDAEYTSDSNIIPYEKYVKDDTVQKKVAICYKTPLYLTKAKQVQPTLYNGHKLVKTTHAPAIVHDSEDALELAETTRMKMLEKSKTLMMYPPNAPAKLVSKRITPTGLIEGERGFEQTKECYLTEVIQFLKTLKEHVEGIQMALVKEVKEMKEIFKQMEAEVELNVVDKQCADTERNNLLIKNENLIADCLSNELLYSVMNDVNMVSRFFKLHDAYTIGQARCLKLEAEISKLKHKIQKDDHSEMIKYFSSLEIDHLNFQLKYQNLKEHFGNNNLQPSQDTPDFDTVFKINKMKASLQGKDNAIRKLKEQISQMNER